MTFGDQLVLYGLLGLSLVGPGPSGVFRPVVGRTWLIAESSYASNNLRALDAMMPALVVARVYSPIVDGRPGALTVVCFGVEGVLAGVFLFWPPPAVA